MGLLRKVSRLLAAGHRWKRLKFALASALQDQTLYPLGVHPRFDAELCARMFLRNQRLLHHHVQASGGQAVTYLQPSNGFGARQLSRFDSANLAHMRRRIDVDGLSEPDAIDRVFAHLIAQFKREPAGRFVDLTSVFNDVPYEVYVDQVHCSDIGYDLIAQRIAGDIIERDSPTG